ncbi:lipase family protein [Rhodococcus spongiicola]|uniref:Lipase n=1 Tax=Rhodococcus spongiicola TaxID=2487352 RepID=A0A3S3ABF1_9NOCA|nr:lipase [Rhodococcus spongiicola]
MIGRLVGASVLAIGLALGAVPAAAAPTSSAPGTVVEAVELDSAMWIPGTARATKVTYWTTGPLDQPALSSGAVFMPSGTPPPDGWPVISWAHGTVGIADRCAPSIAGTYGRSYLAHWLSEGYAIVATDYLGLGTPGVHPYLDGKSAAHSVTDMVRAGRAVEPSLSPRWVALGQSQGGHAAMVTAARATTYAPELDFLGAVATGTPANLETLAPLVGPDFPQLPFTGTTVFVSFILAGLRAARPDLDVNGYLSDVGRAAVDAAESECYADMAPVLEDVSIGDLVVRDVDDPAMLAALDDMLAVPVSGYDRPVFLGHGMTDLMVPAPLALKLAADLAINRQPVTFRRYPGGHLETQLDALPDATAFVGDLFECPPGEYNCAQSSLSGSSG